MTDSLKERLLQAATEAVPEESLGCWCGHPEDHSGSVPVEEEEDD